MSTGYQNVIDIILSGGSDQQIIEATLQQTRYDSGHALQMMAAARGSGNIATVVSINPIISFESPDGNPVAVPVTGRVIPETTGTTFTLMQGITQLQQVSVLPAPGGILNWVFGGGGVPVGTNYTVVVTVPALPDFVPVVSNPFDVVDMSIGAVLPATEPLPELRPNLVYAPIAQPEGARMV